MHTTYPIGASITLADLERNPHPFLHRLRAAEPVSWVPVLNAWLVTRYDLAVAVMRDAKTYTVDHPGFSTGQVVGPSMLSLDGARHLQHRGPFERPFRRRAVEDRFRRPVAQHITEILDGFVADGQAELRRDFAGPVAARAMIAALGLEEIPVATVLHQYDAIVDAVTRVAAGESVSRAGRVAFHELSNSLLPSLKADGKLSLLAAAAGVAQGLTNEQIISNAAVLLFGGIETTEGMIANALYFLLTNPDVLATVRAEPEAIPAVVEESLRMEPAAAVVDRYAVNDAKLGGAQIREGDLVQVSLAGANRDPAIFAKPGAFDPTRTNLQSHVAFAQGPHVCLGLHLARLETHMALHKALALLPNLALAETEAAASDARPQGLIFRKPQRLNVFWDAS